MSSQDYYQQPPPQGYPPQGYPPQGYPPQGYPPQGAPPPMQYQQQPPPPQTVIVEHKEDRGCLATCLATLCCCWLCGETCECFFDILSCCC